MEKRELGFGERQPKNDMQGGKNSFFLDLTLSIRGGAWWLSSPKKQRRKWRWWLAGNDGNGLHCFPAKFLSLSVLPLTRFLVPLTPRPLIGSNPSLQSLPPLLTPSVQFSCSKDVNVVGEEESSELSSFTFSSSPSRRWVYYISGLTRSTFNE